MVDDEYIRNVIASALAKLGTLTHTACSGEEDLAVLAENSVDLLLTDINMPVMDGLELLARV